MVDKLRFDDISIIIIIINTIVIIISDPTDPNNFGNRTDNYFLIFYIFEAILKIITFSFYSAEDAYLKDYWNILDFAIVIIGVISFFLDKLNYGGKKITGLSALKAFRIIRPLKTVKQFKELKKLVMALLASIIHLKEILTILFFFYYFLQLQDCKCGKDYFIKDA